MWHDLRVYTDYGDYDADVIDDCVMIPLSTTHSDTPVYVTAFYESRDDAAAVACSNGSMTSSSRVHVISVTGVGPLGDDVRRRLPRIRVNIVSAASSSSAAGNVSSGLLRLYKYFLLNLRRPTYVRRTRVRMHRDQPSSPGKCAISPWPFENTPNFTENWQSLRKFAVISQTLPILISKTCSKKGRHQTHGGDSVKSWSIF